MPSFQTPYDIANRALQHLGAVRISTFADNSRNATEAGFLYDKCRRAELRANLWNFSARRVVLRPFLTNSSMVFFSPTWNNATTYFLGYIAFYNGINWVSTVNNNLNLTPGFFYPYGAWQEFPAPAFVNPWVNNTVYYPGETVFNDKSMWTAADMVPIGTPAPTNLSAKYPWVLNSGLTFATPFIFSPLTVTSSTLSSPKTRYPLPLSYIRVMPQDPKTPSTIAQYTTGGMQFADYEFEENFLMTNQTGPIVFRFASDVQIVLFFDDLFCETLAASMAIKLNEVLTQSAQKEQMLKQIYEETVDKAQRVNAIEAGSTEPDTSEVKTNRIPALERMRPPQQTRVQQGQQ